MTYILDGTDKDDSLEADEFAEGVMNEQIGLDTAIESDQRHNGHDDGKELEHLNPDVCKMHTVGGDAVGASREREYGDQD